jgi:hypothetical protein
MLGDELSHEKEKDRRNEKFNAVPLTIAIAYITSLHNLDR